MKELDSTDTAIAKAIAVVSGKSISKTSVATHMPDGGNKEIKDEFFETIADALPFLNFIWLRFGEGKMLRDWFLPSKDELNLLYLNKDAVGNFSSNSYYYSSTEFDKWNAWCQYMEYDLDNNYKSGSQSDEPKIFTFRVRAIRAF